MKIKTLKFLSAAFAVMMLLSSCDKKALENIAKIPVNVGYNSPSFAMKIDTTSVSGQTVKIHLKNVYVNVDSIIGTQKNLSKDQIKSFRVKTITFKVDSGMPNFNFLKDVASFYAVAGTGNNVLIGQVNNMKDGLTTFTVNTTSTDANGYDIWPNINEKYFNFSFDFTNDAPITKTTYLTATIGFNIEATVTED